MSVWSRGKAERHPERLHTVPRPVGLGWGRRPSGIGTSFGDRCGRTLTGFFGTEMWSRDQARGCVQRDVVSDSPGISLRR